MVRTTLSYKVNVETLETLRKVCRARGENISTFSRRAVLKELARLGYLSFEDCKALGLEGEANSLG